MRNLKYLYEFLDSKVFYKVSLERTEDNFIDRFTTIYEYYFGKAKITNYIYSFFDNDENKYEIFLTYNHNINALSISFLDSENMEAEYKFKQTNRHDQINVLNTVINSVKVFINSYNVKVDYIVVAGSNSKKLRIYNYLLNKHLKEFFGSNWTKTEIENVMRDGELHYIIISKNSNAESDMFIEDEKLKIHSRLRTQ